MTDKLQSFKNYLCVNKKSSTSTVEAYLRDVKQFMEYCVSPDFSSITAKEINAYINSLDKSEATKVRTIASLRAFFNCLILSGHFCFKMTKITCFLKRTVIEETLNIMGF